MAAVVSLEDDAQRVDVMISASKLDSWSKSVVPDEPLPFEVEDGGVKIRPSNDRDEEEKMHRELDEKERVVKDPLVHHVQAPVKEEEVRFKPDETINRKIVLWLGDIAVLDVDCVVNPTNDTYTERETVSLSIFDKAGADLTEECATLEPCRTGEVHVTKSYRLPCKRIIHTVGPRYNVKYRTAAENALHSCYRSGLQYTFENGFQSIAFPVVNTERKGYPKFDAAHVVFRTVRRFLEHYPDNISLVVFAVDNDVDLEIYRRVLPVYFPRTEEEALLMAKYAPKDLGNQWGEAVIPERQIRIAALPVHEGASQSRTRGEHEARRLAPDAPAEPLDMNQATRTFGRMAADPDQQRLRAAATKTKSELEREEAARLYQKFLRRARVDELTDIAAMDVFYESGHDRLGRPVVTLVGSRLPRDTKTLDRILTYIIRIMDGVADRDFAIIYVHTNTRRSNQPELAWLRRTYYMLPRKYKKNMKALYIVHPSFWLRVLFFLLSPFLSDKVWKKVKYVNNVAELFESIAREQIYLPEFVFRRDRSAGDGPGPSSTLSASTRAVDSGEVL